MAQSYLLCIADSLVSQRSLHYPDQLLKPSIQPLIQPSCPPFSSKLSILVWNNQHKSDCIGNPCPKSYSRVLPPVPHEATASLVLLSYGCCFSLSLPLRQLPLFWQDAPCSRWQPANHVSLPPSPQSTGLGPADWIVHLRVACPIHLPTDHFPSFTKGHDICLLVPPCTLSSATTKTIHLASCCFRWVQKRWVV